MGLNTNLLCAAPETKTNNSCRAEIKPGFKAPITAQTHIINLYGTDN